MTSSLPYSGKFSQSNTSLRKFLPAKISSRKNFFQIFFADELRNPSTSHCPRAVDPVTQQKIDPIRRRSIEQTAEIFCDVRSTPLSSPQLILVVSCSLWHGSSSPTRDSDPNAFISAVTSYYRFGVEIHAEFPGSVSISMCEL